MVYSMMMLLSCFLRKPVLLYQALANDSLGETTSDSVFAGIVDGALRSFQVKTSRAQVRPEGIFVAGVTVLLV